MAEGNEHLGLWIPEKPESLAELSPADELAHWETARESLHNLVLFAEHGSEEAVMHALVDAALRVKLQIQDLQSEVEDGE